MNIREIQVLRPGSLQGSDALASTAHCFCARGRGVGCGAVGHVSIGDVGAARRRRLRVQLVMEAQGWGAVPNCLRRACTLAVRIAARFVCSVGIERAVAEEGIGALVALLLKTLRAHGAKEPVGCQRNMGSTGRRRWAAVS